MNKFERWFLKRIFAKQVRQGMHEQNIVELFKMIREAANNEFTEDNEITLDIFMADCYMESVK